MIIKGIIDLDSGNFLNNEGTADMGAITIQAQETVTFMLRFQVNGVLLATHTDIDDMDIVFAAKPTDDYTGTDYYAYQDTWVKNETTVGYDADVNFYTSEIVAGIANTASLALNGQFKINDYPDTSDGITRFSQLTSMTVKNSVVSSAGTASPVLFPRLVSSGTAPAASNDATEGYDVGSVWVKTGTGNTAYILIDSTEDAAIWSEMTSETGSPVTLNLSDGDVAHGITNVAPTDVFGNFTTIHGTQGGLYINGLSDQESASARSLALRGICNDTHTDSIPTVEIIGAKRSGTSVQALAAAETVLTVANHTTEVLTVLGSGNVTVAGTVDGVDIASRDSVLTSTTTTAGAALPKAGGAMTGAITTNSTFDGVDVATRDAVLTSTTSTASSANTTANAALPKSGGLMSGYLGLGVASADYQLHVTNSDSLFEGAVGIGLSGAPSYTLEVGGSIVGSSKSFLIDHPTKEGKKLMHGSLEGAEHGVYFRGESQVSKIEAPDYWVGLVDQDTVTALLTAVGGDQNIYVDSVESNGDVNVASNTSEPLNYFYVVYGERKDIDKLEIEHDIVVEDEDEDDSE